MSTNYPHTAQSVFFGCIDDRVVASQAQFIAENGTAFHPCLAGGGAAILDPASRDIALKQIVIGYIVGGVTTVYLENHTDCGAYRLAGITFDSAAAELDRHYTDLDEAKDLVITALTKAGADPKDIQVITRVINLAGELQARPVMQEAN